MIINGNGRLDKVWCTRGVHEFCFKEKWELIYLTAQIENTTFGIKKL